MGSRLKIIVTALALAAVMTACGSEQRFKVVERFPGGCVYVDKDTGIGYGKLYDQCGMFPLYGTDGELYRPNGWRDIGE